MRLYRIAYAHCDIPCGIYDPHNAQMAAHTIIRMTQLLEETKRDSLESEHNIARLTHVKEEHGQLVEEELGTLENDYFKEEHFKKFPKLKDLLARGVKLSITTRQNIDMKSAEELLKITQEIAEIFFKTKGAVPVRVKSLYPTQGEIVTHK
ncbi:MAG: hypothetical protein US77_C0016G0004 [Microgenomates group bacterium GW2011_GWC1_38_14]|nr:MAG: hypothetical protein US02_C0020G0004 [Candidatus Levybacteria bacterium GW2011_GWA2_36_13]KKQ57893.1 MAG: hypothetical protein US77_C0016G0004 [Microgenomates group bacterium GW2011_GWC1_38_14]OGH44520.1 MAG: superoxide dismutase, Ni [Candidatus Levybacteria bacterium RIFCSPLOWO2_02_FULL_37_11]